MSIRRIQTERALEAAVYELYSSGKRPTFGEVAEVLSAYFSLYPLGRPLPVPLSDIIRQVSDPDQYNELLGRVVVNLGVLYQSALEQVEDTLELTQSLQNHLDRLTKRRKTLETKIDDFLLSNFNTEGYYSAVSDTFDDISLTDLTLTSAAVDTTSGRVEIPSLSGASSKLPKDQISNPRYIFRIGDQGKPYPYDLILPFANAVDDDTTNTAWIIEVETERPEEVVFRATIALGEEDNPVKLSRLEFDPYGAAPVQMAFQYRDANGNFVPFGGGLKTSSDKVVYSQDPVDVNEFQIFMRKKEHDYVTTDTGKTKYRYIFGAKSIVFTHQTYESNATFVSAPLGVPSSDLDFSIIDAVSLDVNDSAPPGTSINYYIAQDVGDTESLDDFEWRRITPVTKEQQSDKVVRFDGTIKKALRIRLEPEEGDVQQKPITGQGVITDRNPSPTIIPGVDVYRIADIDDETLVNSSVELIEGVNTLRILHKTISQTEFRDLDLSYWGFDVRKAASAGVPISSDVTYGRIDKGNGFFFGGDVGVPGRDVYAETFIDSPQTFETFVDEFRKSDVRSKLWPVRVYHNGRLVGDLPAGIDRLQIPWRFTKGMNHIAITMRIPEDGQISSVHAGSLVLMSNNALSNFGTVHLAKWDYIDFFNLQFNDSGDRPTFTVHNGEIITRRRPTTNFLMKYAVRNGNNVHNVRLRADMSRDKDSPNTTPFIDDYRLRFSIG